MAVTVRRRLAPRAVAVPVRRRSAACAGARAAPGARGARAALRRRAPSGRGRGAGRWPRPLRRRRAARFRLAFRPGLERPVDVVEREQRGEAREVDAPAVADDRVEAAAPRLPDGRARLRAERPRRALVEVGDEDEIADDRRRAGDLLPERAHPALLAGARVQRVEVAVVGADVDRRRRRCRPCRRPARRRRSCRCSCATPGAVGATRTSTRRRSCCRCTRARSSPPPTSRSCPRRSRARPCSACTDQTFEPFERRIACTRPP